MSKKFFFHITILYIIIAILIVAVIWLFSLYSMQKDVLNTYKKKFIEEHSNELINNTTNIINY